MTALLIRRRRPIGDPSGAGRVIHLLAEYGFVLETIQQLALDAELQPADLDVIDAVDRFDLVILGSHLVNVPDPAVRTALLRLAGRHLSPLGSVLVEHHPLDWAETAASVRPTPGASDLGMVDVRRDAPFVSAVSVYDVGGHVVRQPFRAQVLSELELDEALDAAGLIRRERPAPTWLRAGAVAPKSPQTPDV